MSYALRLVGAMHVAITNLGEQCVNHVQGGVSGLFPLQAP